MASYPNLLSPLKLGPYVLPNRVVMAPMTRGRAGKTYTANPLMSEYYSQRASAGLIITEGTQTSLQARGWFQAPDIYTQSHVDAWKITTDAVHEKNGKIFCQLWHTGRASHSNFRKGMEGVQDPRPVAPSPIKRPSRSGTQMYTEEAGSVEIETPREMTLEEVEGLKEEFRNAAAMAKEAGFDGVELHCANGYLLDTFLQTCSNNRTDKYGGTLENRFRVVKEALEGIFQVYESECVAVRLSPNGIFNGMGSDDYRESFLYYAEQLKQFNLGYLHVMIGLGFGFHEKGEPMTMKDFRNVYPGVLMANVGYDAELAEKEIKEGHTDLVSFGRLYISNPDLVQRFEKGAQLADVPTDKLYSSYEDVHGAEGLTDFPVMAK